MSQTWNPISNTNIANALANAETRTASLRSRFSGTSFPSDTVAGMECIREDENLLYVRNEADSAWVAVGPAYLAQPQPHILGERTTLSAATKLYLPTLQQPFRIERVTILSDTTTIGSVASTTEWQFTLTNKTTTNQLFSGTVGTGTALGGVGGGEITLDVPYILVPDQNAGCSAGDVLELALTTAGSPTTLARASFLAELSLAEAS